MSKIEADDFENEEVVVKRSPLYGDEDWSDYVMTLFLESELEDGKPKCDGLRRVMHKLFDVVYAKPVKYEDTVVQYEVCFLPRKVMTIDMGGSYPTITIGAIASASKENTKHPYSKYLHALAETRAEARAYRKALLLKCVAAEETDEAEMPEAGEAKSSQLTAINVMCKKNKISLDKLITFHKKTLGKLTTGSMTNEQASKILTLLNNYQSTAQGTNSIPEEIKE